MTELSKQELALTTNTWGDVIYSVESSSTKEDLVNIYCHFRMTLHIVLNKNELLSLIKNLKKGIDFKEVTDTVESFEDDDTCVDVETFSLEDDYKEYEINTFPAKIKPILDNKESKELLECLKKMKVRSGW